MNSKRIQLLLTGVAVWTTLLLMSTTTYGGSIVIGGNYTDIGTIVIVSPKPGDTPQNNGAVLLNTFAGITGDINNPYLIKLGPGIYDIGTSSLQMKEYVDVEGSGENTTIITGHIGEDLTGVVQGASNTEIRFLSVQNTGGGTYAGAIVNVSASLRMTNVTASASGGSGSYNYAVTNSFQSFPTMTNVTASASGGMHSYGVYNNNSSPTMTNVTASASGGTESNGVNNLSSSPTMTNVTASASGGTNNYGVYSFSSGTIMINNSVIIGSTNALYNGSDTTTRAGNTKLDGGPISNLGTLTCVGAYNGNYVSLGTDCQ
jgi:hypothetical protein